MKIYKVKVNGKVYEVELEAIEEKAASIVSEKKEEKVVSEKEEKPTQQVTSSEGTTLKAPMQGTILKVDCQVGDQVKKGQVLFILEAMKLENEIVSPNDGVISSINVTKGQTVNNQEVLAVIG